MLKKRIYGIKLILKRIEIEYDTIQKQNIEPFLVFKKFKKSEYFL